MNEEKEQSMYTAEDIEENKNMAGLAYIIFFLPLLAVPDSQYARFHANQGLLLLILAVGGQIILGVIPLLGWILMLPFGIFTLILGVMEMMNGFGGKVKELPLIGKFRIIE